jgi:Bifunctional DNA primase/polymerase, N-terminal
MHVKKITSEIPEDIERVALLGWRVHPCSRVSRAAMFKDAAAHSSCDLDVIARWVDFYPRCNWRVVMQGSGILALDLDVPGPDHTADGIAAFASMVNCHEPLPPCPRLRTGGGGLVLFFADHGEVICGQSGYPVAGIDPKRGPLTVTLPPSVHHRSSLPYRWIAAPWAISPPPMPAWLARLLVPPEPRRYPPRPAGAPPDNLDALVGAACRAIAGAVPGTRNHTLNRWAFILGTHIQAGRIGEAEARGRLLDAARLAGMEFREADLTITSGFRGGRKC